MVHIEIILHGTDLSSVDGVKSMMMIPGPCLTPVGFKPVSVTNIRYKPKCFVEDVESLASNFNRSHLAVLVFSGDVDSHTSQPQGNGLLDWRRFRIEDKKVPGSQSLRRIASAC